MSPSERSACAFGLGARMIFVRITGGGVGALVCFCGGGCGCSTLPWSTRRNSSCQSRPVLGQCGTGGSLEGFRGVGDLPSSSSSSRFFLFWKYVEIAEPITTKSKKISFSILGDFPFYPTGAVVGPLCAGLAIFSRIAVSAWTFRMR